MCNHKKNQATRTWVILYYLFCFLRRPNNNNEPNVPNNPPNNVALFEPLFSLPVSGNAFCFIVMVFSSTHWFGLTGCMFSLHPSPNRYLSLNHCLSLSRYLSLSRCPNLSRYLSLSRCLNLSRYLSLNHCPNLSRYLNLNRCLSLSRCPESESLSESESSV